MSACGVLCSLLDASHLQAASSDSSLKGHTRPSSLLDAGNLLWLIKGAAHKALTAVQHRASPVSICSSLLVLICQGV